jgi:hypothetical protein
VRVVYAGYTQTLAFFGTNTTKHKNANLVGGYRKALNRVGKLKMEKL